jgi:hypothetical protein
VCEGGFVMGIDIKTIFDVGLEDENNTNSEESSENK